MKIYAFIDSQNLNMGTRSAGWNLDFGKFKLYLRNKYNVEKVFLFIGYIPKNNKLYEQLEKYGYILIYRPTLITNGKIKGNVDAELVLHTMIEIDNYHKAIIVSGDGDFYCLIEYLEKRNKLEAIITPNSKYSSLLRKFNNKIVVADKFKSSVRKKKTKINVRSKS